MKKLGKINAKLKNSKGGRGSFPIQRMSLQIFCISLRYISVFKLTQIYGKSAMKNSKTRGGRGSKVKVLKMYLTFTFYFQFKTKNPCKEPEDFSCAEIEDTYLSLLFT